MARYTASSSQSKVLYLVSRGLSLFEKKAIGLQALSTSYCNTATTALLEVSVMSIWFGICKERSICHGLFDIIKSFQGVLIPVEWLLGFCGI